jgi:ABC-type transporter Mla subunit MlaD
MSKQAQVGAFALLALLLLFGVFYVITDFGTRHTGYKVGVHFDTAAGLHGGALVYFSGVPVGSVDSIELLKDNTVDAILAIKSDTDIPRASKFIIQAPLTGDPSLVIVPPIGGNVPQSAMLEREVLPVENQPRGINSATVADLMEQGQGEIKRLDVLLADLEKREPALLNNLQEALANANSLTLTAKESITSMTGQLSQATANIVALTGTLNDTTQLNSHRINDILTNFDQTSKSLNTSMNSLQELATNKELKGNLTATVKSIADTMDTISGITKDLKTLTGDPQTQAQMKNTVANLDATLQRANSLLGALGGKSNVYGVDKNATPYPLSTGAPNPMSSSFPRNATDMPEVKQIELKQRLTKLAENLISVQVRISELGLQNVCCLNPRLSANRGPEADINAIILPHAPTSLMFGVNNTGHGSTGNLAVLQSFGPNARFGGGLLYSQLGMIGKYDGKFFGVEGRLYDLQRPQLDLYGNLNLTKNLQIFLGERAANHNEHRFTYGIQAQIP